MVHIRLFGCFIICIALIGASSAFSDETVPMSNVRNVEKLPVLAGPQETLEFPVKKGKKEIYMWSGTFNKTENSNIINFLESKSISSVLLSFSKSLHKEKALDFMSRAKRKQINIVFMKSKTEWLNEDYRKSILQEITELEKYSPAGLHLDIEPHHFRNWRENNYAILDGYIKMLRYIRKNYRGELSVSIPVMYPDRILQDIYKIADKVYIMAYGKNNMNKLAKRVAEELSYGVQRSVIGVRCIDFKNEHDFENYIEKILSTVATDKVIIYDFKQYLELVQDK